MKYRFVVMIIMLVLTGCSANSVQEINKQESKTNLEENVREPQKNSTNNISDITNKETITTEDNDYETYLVDLNFEDYLVDEAKFKFKIEKKLDNYTIERHKLVVNGSGTNDLFGDIIVDLNFEYPRINNIQDKAIERIFNESVFKNFLHQKSLQDIMNDSLFESSNRYESGTYEVTYADNDTVSISAHAIYNARGAPTVDSFGITLSIKDGELLLLNDFVDDEYIQNSINDNQFDVVGEEVGVGGSKATDENNKNSFVEYIAKTYSFIDEPISDDITFSFDMNGYYIDENNIYIYINSIMSYGRDFYLKIPLPEE